MLRVIACGGDGTIAWIIQGIINCGFENLPQIGMIPLGTGNDLSRMLGWGPGYCGEEIETILANLLKAKPKPIDLWNCYLTPWNPETGEIKEDQTTKHIMLNYFNLGFDSQVALEFHKMRNSYPDLFKARIINQGWYCLYALENFVFGYHDLIDSCHLEIDGRKITIPKGIKTIVALNFVYYQAGADIWGFDPNPNNIPNVDDGSLEVIGIGGMFQEIMIRMYLTSGIRLGKGKTLQFKITKPATLAMSFDGEPFLSEPSIVTIQAYKQIQVLEKKY